MTISFKVSRTEHDMIVEIGHRAMGLKIARGNDPFTLQDIIMDLTACHANGCPLRLDELCSTEGFDFAHDILGIRTHLNRETGKLEDCFVPRFAS